MSKIALIIKREFVAKVRNKSFIVMTFLSPLLFVGIAAFVGFLSTMKADLKTIAIHDETGKFVKEFKSDEEYKYVDFSKTAIKLLFEKEEMKLEKVLPMKFDSFYVSLLSEKYKSGKMNFVRAFFVGWKSNLSGKKTKEFSSHIYIIKNQ